MAPQATIYGYNYMAQQTIFNESDAMTRNATGTAVSNIAGVPRTIPVWAMPTLSGSWQ